MIRRATWALMPFILLRALAGRAVRAKGSSTQAVALEESHKKGALLEEIDMLRNEVEQLRQRVRELEDEKEANAPGNFVADSTAMSYLVDGQERARFIQGPSESQRAANWWGIEDAPGKYKEWNGEEQRGFWAWLCAIVFVGVFGAAPIMPHIGEGAMPVTRVHIIECACLYIWLFVGMYLFTQVIHFQSVHFREPRPLNLEEAVYLIAQIITTVGYGDITPKYPGGQCFVGCFVFLAIVLAGQMISELTQNFEKRMEVLLTKAGLNASRQLSRLRRSTTGLLGHSEQDHDEAWKAVEEAALQAKTEKDKLWAASQPMINSAFFFLFFAFSGAAFFVLYPGENKTVLQGIYMSMITLSTVGFGAFTPVTHGGMVFGAFWMLFGVASLASLVSARAAFAMALMSLDRERTDEDGSGSQSIQPRRNMAGGIAVAAHQAGLRKRKEERKQAGISPNPAQKEEKAEEKAQDAGSEYPDVDTFPCRTQDAATQTSSSMIASGSYPESCGEAALGATGDSSSGSQGKGM